MCGNYLGQQVTNSTCAECDITVCDTSLKFSDAYATGNLGMHIIWYIIQFIREYIFTTRNQYKVPV